MKMKKCAQYKEAVLLQCAEGLVEEVEEGRRSEGEEAGLMLSTRS